MARARTAVRRPLASKFARDFAAFVGYRESTMVAHVVRSGWHRAPLRAAARFTLGLALIGLMLLPQSSGGAVHGSGDHLTDGHLAVQVVAARDRVPLLADLGPARHGVPVPGIVAGGLAAMVLLVLGVVAPTAPVLAGSQWRPQRGIRGPPGAPRAR